MRRTRKPAGAAASRRMAPRSLPGQARRRPLAIVQKGGKYGPAHPAGWNDRLCDTFGTTSLDFAQSCAAWLMAMQRPGVPPDILVSKTNGALAAVHALRPRDEMEAMLAVQMAATHDFAMEALAEAKRQGSGPEAQVAMRLANDILQTYTRQVDALATLRRVGKAV